jgi:site-specific recombinase XerD
MTAPAPTDAPAAVPALAVCIAAFLDDLRQANRAAATIRTYATDLHHFTAWYAGSLDGMTEPVLRAYFRTLGHLKPTSRARKQAALASFLTWAVRQAYLSRNPVQTMERVRCDPPAPVGLTRTQVETILAVIPKAQERDRLLFRLLFETGLRIGEALHLTVDDLDLTRDDEHLRVRGKGGQRRTVLLDDPRLVAQLRTYLAHTGYQHGWLFRAQKNGDGQPLRYQSVQERWGRYCGQAGIACTLHQLRHTHATELVNEGVSLNTIRKRLGHRNIQTTLRYADQRDATADAELRAWRRRKQAKP